MPKTRSKDKTTIGLMFIDIEYETMLGATIIPSKLIAYTIPAAVEAIWISKDSVCKQIIKVYPTAFDN